MISMNKGFKDTAFAFIWLLQIGLIPQANSTDIIRSSVSPEFPDGLHKKYLDFLATQLDKTLEVYPMPFARRLLALRQGDIDLMVGLKGSHEENEDFIFLHPSYEKLGVAYFVLKEHLHTLKSEGDLKMLLLATTIDGEYRKTLEGRGLRIAPVTNLQQKIDMLMSSRVDAFVHFFGSTTATLKKMQLSEVIVPAIYQPQETREYFVAISLKGGALPYKERLEEIISRAIRDGVFETIRKEHYANQTTP